MLTYFYAYSFSCELFPEFFRKPLRTPAPLHDPSIRRLKPFRTTGVLEAIWCTHKHLSIYLLNRDCPLRSPKELSAFLRRPQSFVFSISAFVFFCQSLWLTALVSASDLLLLSQPSSFLPAHHLPTSSVSFLSSLYFSCFSSTGLRAP